jgi:parvulin-like peptidyl-prolyl isomerase
MLVNDELLDIEEIRARAAAMRLERESTGQVLTLDERVALQQEAADSLIDALVIVQEAKRFGLTPKESEVDEMLALMAPRLDGVAGCRAGADVAEAREDLRRRMMIDNMIQRWRSNVPPPRNEELRAYYLKNKEEFYSPEMVHAAHIVQHFETGCDPAPVLENVEQLRARVLAGESFADVAADCSDCPENNGDLGWFPRGVMVEEFDNAVFACPAGTVTPVFQTVFGYHFAIVYARKAAGIRPFNEVRAQIQQSLWLQKQDREAGKQLLALRQCSSIRSIK